MLDSYQFSPVQPVKITPDLLLTAASLALSQDACSAQLSTAGVNKSRNLCSHKSCLPSMNEIQSSEWQSERKRLSATRVMHLLRSLHLAVF